MQDEKLGSIYLIMSPSGGRYVGKTEKSVDERWRIHKCVAKKGSHLALHRAMRKYGPDSFTVEEICSDVPVSILPIIEMAMIHLLNTFGSGGYNMTEGGEGMSGFKFSPESINKLKTSLTGRSLSDEHRLTMSAVRKGKPSPTKGHVLTEEHKNRVSAALTGRSLSDEHKRNLSTAKTGVSLSEEHKQKLSIAHKGKPSTRKGFTHSEETKRKLSAMRKGKAVLEETKLKISASLKRSHCKNGHPLTPENINKWRACKLCVKARNRTRRPAGTLAVAA